MMRRFLLWRFSALALGAAVISGCGDRVSSTGPIFFEFKQQPGDKYVYTVFDRVTWTIQDSAGKAYSLEHLQEQTSVMKFTAIDSNAVRDVSLSFVVLRDSTLSAMKLPWRKGRPSLVGHKYEFQLRMQPNGGILAVESNNPALTFFYDTGYRPSQPAFPEHAIAVGYSWTRSADILVPRGEPATVKSEYKFSALQRVGEFDCAVIDFHSELEYVENYTPKEKCAPPDCIGRSQCRTTSMGQLYFAYREGFVVKKVNLLTSIANSTVTSSQKEVARSRTEMRDQETIALVAIYRSGGEKLTFDIK